MRRKKTIKRKTRNVLRKIIGLFLIFCITLVTLASFFVLMQKQSAKIVTPLGISFSLHKTIPQTDIVQNLLQKENYSLGDISVSSDSSILVKLKTGEEIIFTQNKDPKEQIASLQLIRARLTIEGRRFSRIDFRFDNPVITF